MSSDEVDASYLRDLDLVCQLQWRHQWSSSLHRTDVGAGLCAVMDLSSRVNNGGFDMYFRGDAVRSHAVALRTLERIGAPKTVDVLRDALALLGDEGPARGQVARHAQVDRIDREAEAALSERFWTSGESLVGALAAFASEHLGELVVPHSHRPTQVRRLDAVDAAALEAHPVWVHSGIADYAYAWVRDTALDPWGLHALSSFAEDRGALTIRPAEGSVPADPAYLVRATFTQPNGSEHIGRVQLSKALSGVPGWDVRFADPVLWVGGERVQPWLGERTELGDAEWAQLFALEAADAAIWPLIGTVAESVCRTPPPPIVIDGYYRNERGVVRAVALP